MSERPILFSAPMIRAILAGTKTQTRRLVKPQPAGDLPVRIWWKGGRSWDGAQFANVTPPWGQVANHSQVVLPRLWVREAWRTERSTYDHLSPSQITDERALNVVPILYEADADWSTNKTVGKLRPGMFMPRWASRITLELTDVRVERLQEISEADAIAEGCAAGDDMHNALFDPNTGRDTLKWTEPAPNAKESFCNLWQRLHAKRGQEETPWEQNPWVWVLCFRRLP